MSTVERIERDERIKELRRHIRRALAAARANGVDGLEVDDTREIGPYALGIDWDGRRYEVQIFERPRPRPRPR